MTRLSIRPFDAGDEAAVLRLWNLCLTRDPITTERFRRNVMLDTNFDTAGCFIAESENGPAGFLLSLRRRYPYYDLGLEPEKGWITVFFVEEGLRRRGFASAMLRQAEEFLRASGVRQVSVADYTPNYFTPGIDVDAYPAAVEFLQRRGFEKTDNVYSMGRSLTDFEIPNGTLAQMARLERSGFSVDMFSPRHALPLLEFLRREYPGDLFGVAHEHLLRNPECDDILVACKDGAVVGFSRFEDEHFGPFGIAREHMGRGLGPLLFVRTVEQMRRKGKRSLWLAWTGGRAKDFYHKMGLNVLRRQIIFRKQLA